MSKSPTKEQGPKSSDKPDAAAKSPLKIFEDVYFQRLNELEDRFINFVPDVVYHYTNVTSFMNLLQSRRLWASRSEFLNDATEFRYGQKVALEQINRLKNANSKYEPAANLIRKHTIGDEIESSFVTCFCADGDLLSQWRGYSSHGQGISVGFRSDALRNLPGVEVNNVVYDPPQQAELMLSQMRLLADSCQAVGLDLHDPKIAETLAGYSWSTENYCALIKDPAFREESESRVVVPDFARSDYELRYRMRNNLIVPYIEIDVSPIWDNVVADIIIGPGPDRETRIKNVEHFLRLIKLDARVKFSRCQFR
jgi:hypothetical protein